jgi:hypothetical protein
MHASTNEAAVGRSVPKVEGPLGVPIITPSWLRRQARAAALYERVGYDQL